MKCRSVACIWSSSAPPSHKVTATAVLHHPLTLYTGASDGSIIWWSISPSLSEIKAVALLCGHVTSIADLGICYPVVVSRDDTNRIDSFTNSGALISVCVDGVLCVWSRGSGHCRRRRKLPSWVGTPSIVRTLPTSPRYVCIGCAFVNANEGSEGGFGDQNVEFQYKKPQKGTVVIVDTYSLTIVQTVFHGVLSIGSLNFMDVVLLGEDGEKHSVFMGDLFGKVQLVPILEEENTDGEGGAQKSSHLELADWGHDASEEGHVMACATHGNLIALVFKSCCVFRLLSSGKRIGQFSFMSSLLPCEGNSCHPHVLGGMFLVSGDTGDMQNSQEAYDSFEGKFVVWNTVGSATVCTISYLNDVFNCEPLCEIPAASNLDGMKLSISFVGLNCCLLRIESFCVDIEEPLQWKPQVSIWSFSQKHENCGKLPLQCKMLGQSVSFSDSFCSSSFLHEMYDQGGTTRINSVQRSLPNLEDENNKYTDGESCHFANKGKTVSSSMVVSGDISVPYCIVYGFFSGKIEVMHFDKFLGPDSHGGSPRQYINSCMSRQYLIGHTGAILCLAAHRMLGNAKGWSFSRVLVSGSMDCTIRIWDLDSGNAITVMHQHVAPVRQIIFPPIQTERPWSDCFLSIGEDLSVALVSLETLRVERTFPGHPSLPAKVVWDGARGYIACLCQSHPGISDDVLYIWDVKTGARERILRGTASHSMFDHFCKGIGANSLSGSILNVNTSVSSLFLPIIEDENLSQSRTNFSDNRVMLPLMVSSGTNMLEPSASHSQVKEGYSTKPMPTSPLFLQINKYPIRCTSPFPGISTLSFDLASMMFSCQKLESAIKGSVEQETTNVVEKGTGTANTPRANIDDGSDKGVTSVDTIEEHDWIRSLDEYLLRFSLSFLHLWNLDSELDKLLIAEMKLSRPENLILASGLQGDKGSLTLAFPGLDANLELWKSSSEFCAMRSLTMVSLAQRITSLSHASSAASSALAAFYTRNFAEKVPDIKRPLLQLLVSFWQDESEHVRMAARTLFHCAASQAIPHPLCSQNVNAHIKLVRSLSKTGANDKEPTKVDGTWTDSLASDISPEQQAMSQVEESNVLAWLEPFEVQDWISCVEGTSQDSMTSHIIVAAALAVWYPSLVKQCLARLVVHPLVKLVMAMNEKYSSTAAELLAEGMESTWKACSGFEIARLIGDIFFQIECVSGQSANSSGRNPAVSSSIRETLVGILLPSLAMADVLGFLNVIESQIWSTASDSPVHLVSIATLVRVVRGSPRQLAQYLDKVVNFLLHTMDPGNSVMRKVCLQNSMSALKEVVRVFPMVALNEVSSRLAVGDAIGEINNASISVYDMQSVTKIKVLDASGPPGLPNLLSGASETAPTTLISALSFAPDGEGLVAFSENGLMIRWWSLGSVWWEKLSRSFVPVQCTKLIFVPPWEGFSPNTSRSSIMASIFGHDKRKDLQENGRSSSYTDNFNLLIHNLDLAYRLEWVGARKVLLTRHGQELGAFPL